MVGMTDVLRDTRLLLSGATVKHILGTWCNSEVNLCSWFVIFRSDRCRLCGKNAPSRTCFVAFAALVCVKLPLIFH